MAMLSNQRVYLLNPLGVFLGMSVRFMGQTGGLSNYQVMGCSWCCTHMQLRQWFVLLIFVVGDPEPKIVWSFVIYSTELSNFLGTIFFTHIPLASMKSWCLHYQGSPCCTSTYFNCLLFSSFIRLVSSWLVGLSQNNIAKLWWVNIPIQTNQASQASMQEMLAEMTKNTEAPRGAPRATEWTAVDALDPTRQGRTLQRELDKIKIVRKNTTGQDCVQGGAPQVVSWFIIPSTIDISTISPSY